MYQLLHYNCFEVHKVSPDKVRQCFRENEVNFVIKFLRSADIIIIILRTNCRRRKAKKVSSRMMLFVDL